MVVERKTYDYKEKPEDICYFSDRLRELCWGLDLKEISEEMEISAATLRAHLKRNPRHSPTKETLDEICKYFNVGHSYFQPENGEKVEDVKAIAHLDSKTHLWRLMGRQNDIARRLQSIEKKIDKIQPSKKGRVNK